MRSLSRRAARRSARALWWTITISVVGTARVMLVNRDHRPQVLDITGVFRFKGAMGLLAARAADAAFDSNKHAFRRDCDFNPRAISLLCPVAPILEPGLNRRDGLHLESSAGQCPYMALRSDTSSTVFAGRKDWPIWPTPSRAAESAATPLPSNWAGCVVRVFLAAASVGRNNAVSSSSDCSGRPLVPRAITHNDDIDSCGLSYTELMELWLGPCNDSVFDSPEQLQDAWERGRAVVMRLWGSDGRRPQGWWAFDTELEYPGYDRERSFLYAAGVLSEAERAELEREWEMAFAAARGKSARERRAHYE